MSGESATPSAPGLGGFLGGDGQGSLASPPDHPSALCSFFNVVLAFPKEPLEMCRAVQKNLTDLMDQLIKTRFLLLFADAT